ncbi:MAG: VWA domain-containing protein, partial [Gammaproteobacteria bacterium]|nr:VWA domain-containing protein [Gammaproteobacteria bacterium]
RVHEQPDDAGEQVLVLLTDGANTAGEVEPMKAAELAQQVGLRIYTIGIGAEQLEVSSILGGRRRINPSADLDEKTLTEIAGLTGGRYFRATDTASLQDIYRLVDELEPVEEPESGFRPVRSLYFWPLGGAFVLVSLMCLVSLLKQALRRRTTMEVRTDAG